MSIKKEKIDITPDNIIKHKLGIENIKLDLFDPKNNNIYFLPQKHKNTSIITIYSDKIQCIILDIEKKVLKYNKHNIIDYYNEFEPVSQNEYQKILNNKNLKKIFINAMNKLSKSSLIINKILKISGNLKQLDTEKLSNILIKELKHNYKLSLTKIGIVGGGPIGLLLAYTLYRYGFYDISIYEKREEYNRKHSVLVPYGYKFANLNNIIWNVMGKDNFCLIPKPHNDLDTICYQINEPIFDVATMYGNKYNYFTGISFQISEFEKSFKKKLYSHVKYINKDINNINDIDTQYDVIFGCDGLKSKVRDNILKSTEFTDNYETYGLIVIHSAKNNKDYIKVVSQFKETQPEIRQMRYRIVRGPHDNIYICLQLTSKEYERIYTHKKFKQLPTDIKKIILDYFKLYDMKLNPDIENTNIFPFKMKHVYYDKYADIVNKIPIYMMGDAISQNHIFAGNAGVFAGFQVVEKINRYIISNINKQKTIDEYNLFTKALIKTYYDSTRIGYLKTDISNKICKNLTDKDWDDIKNTLIKTIYHNNHNEYVKYNIDWFNDKKELCNMFSHYMVINYSHRYSNKKTLISNKSSIGYKRTKTKQNKSKTKKKYNQRKT